MPLSLIAALPGPLAVTLMVAAGILRPGWIPVVLATVLAVSGYGLTVLLGR